jgi:FtsP/CotA-like multicopper oxidase with cupredoxin domain
MNSPNTTLSMRALRLPRLVAALSSLLVAAGANAAVPGITGTSGTGGRTFNLVATGDYISQPDGQMVYSWGYGCSAGGGGYLPAGIPGAACGNMQIPGPTLIVTEGETVTVNLTNALPPAAGNTSILFPGFAVVATGGVPGLLAQEAQPNGPAVSYVFTASTPGTHAYYSGTQGDLQIEMGLFGAIVVMPKTIPANCNTSPTVPTPALGVPNNLAAQAANNELDYRLAAAAYDHPQTCYDREYLFQFSELDPGIHQQVQAQVDAINACKTAGGTTCPTSLVVATEPYHPAYFMINGRSMPDDMDPNYAMQYPRQPYNGNPHMHPGEQVLLRIIGQGRWQHPFHEHGNHVRVLARDGNLITSIADTWSPTNTTGTAALAGPLLFTTTTTPGQAMDGIYYYTGRGLNWDMYGHNPADPLATLPCTPDANGYNTGDPAARNYFEWCQDHNKPVEAKPFGDVPGGGPATLPNPQILANGPWYGGSPYLGPDATGRAVGPTPIPPSGTVANSPGEEAGFAFMWHSHNEREITTNNIFPGGMLMMMLVDSREFVIDESL